MKKLIIFIFVLLLTNMSITEVEAKDNPTQEEILEYISINYADYPYDIDDILPPLIWTESRYISDVVSKDGKTIGLTQINPNFHEIEDPYDYKQNIKCCADYLVEKIDNGYSKELALMCWNCGETRAKDLYDQGITTRYARKILSAAKEHEIDAK